MNGEHKVLVVTKDPLVGNYMKSFISHFQHQVFFAKNGDEALTLAQTVAPNIVIIDVVTYGDDWLGTFNQMKDLKGNGTLLLLTDHREIKSISDTLGLGPDAFIRKPLNYEELRTKIGKVLQQTSTPVERRDRVDILKKMEEYPNYHPQLLLGISKKMEEVRTVIDQVAKTDITVLLRGESGTGKELVARTLYNCSQRANKPFVKVLCAAIPEGLLESELFGY